MTNRKNRGRNRPNWSKDTIKALGKDPYGQLEGKTLTYRLSSGELIEVPLKPVYGVSRLLSVSQDDISQAEAEKQGRNIIDAFITYQVPQRFEQNLLRASDVEILDVISRWTEAVGNLLGADAGKLSPSSKN